jgi:hypothetical protein
MKQLIGLVCLGVAFAVSTPAFSGEQQNKMKSCNKDAKAKALKGDERKAFMKNCLRKKPGASADAPKGQSAK